MTWTKILTVNRQKPQFRADLELSDKVIDMKDPLSSNFKNEFNEFIMNFKITAIEIFVCTNYETLKDFVLNKFCRNVNALSY